jgi:hypothetical protein
VVRRMVNFKTFKKAVLSGPAYPDFFQIAIGRPETGYIQKATSSLLSVVKAKSIRNINQTEVYFGDA